MKIYLAPMEGITTFVYRNAIEACYGGVEKYFTPFIATHTKKPMDARERREVLPENNPKVSLVPQMISKDAKDTIRLAEALKEYGYQEVNLNLGCPSGTVVAKGRGSGFLANPRELDAYLEEVYEGLTEREMQLSLKTRLGMYEDDEFQQILSIYRKYPVSELIVHPRVQRDFYKNEPRKGYFAELLAESRGWEKSISLVYNGDINSVDDYRKLCELCGEEVDVMLGRGIIANPNLANEIKAQVGQEGRLDTWNQEQFRRFHRQIFDGYYEAWKGDKNILFRLKELWCYWCKLFPESDKALKRIKKAKSFEEYHEAVEHMLALR